MPRINHAGVPENAEFNIDKKKFNENHEHVFGPEPKVWCDVCEKRLSFCECQKGEDNGQG